jgi:prephenate dehydrogenase
MRVAVIGVGLIGGSIALAARERLGATVSGVDRSHDAMREARKRAAIDRSCETIAEAVQDADAAFVAVTLGALQETIAEVLAAAPGDCVVSDVGSTKRAIAAEFADPRFVGGHPLAGAETSGVEHARSDLFEGATWYLTPTSSTSGLHYDRLYRLLHGIGARPAAIEPDTHDAVLAAVSHLPHVLANVLVAQAAGTLESSSRPPERLPATGPSFRDATRVAGAPTRLWTEIYLSNRDALAVELEDTIARLESFREMLVSADAERIAAWNQAAAGDRRRLLESQLAGGALYQLRASVPNRPGVIADLALALGRAGVNITDMALYPAADMSEGVVALWIAGEAAANRAQELVAGLGFPVSRA